MSRVLAVNVTVGRETYPAGSTPPKEVADRIDNPKAWGEEPSADEKSVPAKKAPAKRSASSKSE